MLVIASFLGIQDPRERPPEARGAADSAQPLTAAPSSSACCACGMPTGRHAKT